VTVHLIKLCVGAETAEDLRAWQASLIEERIARGLAGLAYHDTRSVPKRVEELLDGGSLYWVIRRRIQVRQRILSIEKVEESDGRSYCRIFMDPEIIEVQRRAKRPFQGWRYLEADDAPRDLSAAPGQIRADLVVALKEALVW